MNFEIVIGMFLDTGRQLTNWALLTTMQQKLFRREYFPLLCTQWSQSCLFLLVTNGERLELEIWCVDSSIIADTYGLSFVWKQNLENKNQSESSFCMCLGKNMN